MLEDIQRLPRSISESTDWTPDWRDRQAMAYLAGYRDRFELRAGEGEREAFERALGAGMIRFPVREDDPVVKARFRHLAGAAVPGSEWTAAFDLGEELIRMNPVTLEAASIKGWLLTGLTDGKIAAMHPLTPFQVRVFHDTWFDVRDHLPERDMLMRVICDKPLGADTAEWKRQERRILWTALSCGAETLDELLNPSDRLRNPLNDEELECLARIRRRARNQVNREQAKARKANDNPNTEKFRRFVKGLLVACDRHGVVS